MSRDTVWYRVIGGFCSPHVLADGLKQNGVGLRSICSDHAVRYLRYRARNARPCRGGCRCPQASDWLLRREGVIPDEKKLACQTTPTEFCAQAFGQYLLEVRALARPTIINYVPFIRSFLEDRFGSGRVMLRGRVQAML